ncbi:hypothetical protein BHE82_00900 [Rice orange leaf phytoplasma]|nr:hypothetical protein BHE82_00900 [Rice orange leaf phytoplasma]
MDKKDNNRAQNKIKTIKSNNVAIKINPYPKYKIIPNQTTNNKFIFNKKTKNITQINPYYDIITYIL